MRRTAPLVATALVALLALVWPSAGAACPVCLGGEERSRDAFIWTTVLLSVLPLGMIGGLVGWIWRRTRAQQRGAAPEVGRIPNAG